MLILLKIEWLKIKKYKPVWIIFAFLILLCPTVTIAAGKLFGSVADGSQGLKMLLGGPFDFNTVFNTAAYISNGLNIAWGMLIILMVGNEFQSRTIRQNVIDGQQRNDIINSKLMLVLIFSFASAILVMASGTIAGLIFASNNIYFDVALIKVFGTSFFAAIMQLLFALVFAFLIKKPALSVILYLGYTIFIENVVVQIMVWATKSLYPKLLFTQAADELTANPFLKNINIDGALKLPIEAVWISCVLYAAAILFFLYRYINKTALK